MSQQTNGNSNNVAKCVSSIAGIAQDLEQKKLELRLKAKYIKIEYEKLCKTNVGLKKEIASLEKSISRMEIKLPESIDLMENVKKSSIVADDVMDHLIQYRSIVQENEAQWKTKFDWLIADYENEYQKMRKAMEDKSELYRIYQREANEEKALEIQNRILLKKIDDQKNKIVLRKEINRKLFNNQIVDFAKAVTMYHKNNIVDKEIAERKIRIKSLLKEINNGPPTIVQPVQYNMANPLDDILSRGTSTSFCPNLTGVPNLRNRSPNVDNKKQSILLKELKERLNKGRKIPLQLNDSSSSLMSVAQPQKRLPLQPTDSSSSLKSQRNQPLKRSLPPIQNPNVKKVQILQDTIVPNSVLKPSNLSNNSQIQKKVPKTVSFAMPQQRGPLNKSMEDNSMISSQHSFTGKNRSPFFKENAKTVSNRMPNVMSSKNKQDYNVPDRQDFKTQRREKMDDTNAMERSFLESSRMQGFMPSEFHNTNFDISGTAEEMNEFESQTGLDETVLSNFEREDEGGLAFNNDFNFNFGFGGGSQPTSSAGQQFFF